MILVRLALANLKKKKGLSVTLILLSALAACFLDLGLIMAAQMGEAFSVCAQRLGSPDLIVVSDGAKYKTTFEDFLREDERVAFLEKEEIIYLETSKNSVDSSEAGVVIFNSDTERKIEPLCLLEQDAAVPKEEAIYLPRVMKGSGASLGEKFTLTLKDVDYSFRVAGFFETSYMGTTGNAYLKYFLPAESFQRLHESAGAGKALSVRMRDALPKNAVSSELKRDFLETTDFYTETGGILVTASCLSYDDLEEAILSMCGVPMTILISLAFIICVINFIIVFFKVKEEIDESMTNIGSLQAMGYTTGQILLSKTLEFVLLGAAGAAAGILLARAALPYILRLGEDLIGMAVRYGAHGKEDLSAAFLLLLLMLLSAAAAAWKIKKISPVTALRRGVRTHHFGKNLFPLEKGRGDIYLRLALKNMCRDFRQSITTILAIALGVFSIGISVVLYFNFGYDNSAIVKMTGIELSDVQVKPLPYTDLASLQSELEAMEEVRKVNRSESYMAKIGDVDVQLLVSSDFKKTEVLTVTNGSFPEYDGEVALTRPLLRKLGKEVGDTVRITAKGFTAEYLIVGTGMGTNNGGKMGMMSEQGLRRIDPYYRLSGMDIYLKEGVSDAEFMERLRDIYGVASDADDTAAKDGGKAAAGEMEQFKAAGQKAEEKIRKLLDQYGVSGVEYAVMQEGKTILSGGSSGYRIKEVSSLNDYLEGQLESYTAMLDGMMSMILLVMLLVMGTILSITVSSLLRRQRVELGIYRALGYTTRDLVRIIRLNFEVNAVLGSLLGLLVCRFASNKLLQMFFSNLGLESGIFEIHILWLVPVAVLTTVYLSLLAQFKARRVKKITAYELLSE